MARTKTDQTATVIRIEPINAALAKLCPLTIHQPAVPPEVAELRDAIVARWHRIAAELLGGPAAG